MSKFISVSSKVFLVLGLLLMTCMGCANVVNKMDKAIGAPETIMLTPDNTINLRTSVTEESVKDVMDNIIALREKNPEATLYLVINSPGGAITSGLDLVRFLESQKNIKTITIFAASMASAIVEAYDVERLMVKDATFMFHRAAGTFSGYFNDGEVESRLASAKKMVDILEAFNYERIGISKAKYKELVKSEWWLTGVEAIQENVADRIVKIECNKELIKKTTKIKVGTIFGTYEETVPACPLLK